MSSESTVQNLTRLEFAYNVPAGQLYRNNSGAFQDESGRWIRYGLANDSTALNREIKSSDLIGITPVQIQPYMVGYWLGVFTAFECKPSDWVQRPGDERAAAQARFHDLVRGACGFAGFVRQPADIYPIIGRTK